MTVEYKYEEHICKLAQCPPEECKECNKVAFRVVKSDPPSESDFLPVAVISPQRKLPDDVARCSALGISMFDSLNALKKRMSALHRSNPKVLSKIGVKAARGYIKLSDGVCETSSSNGHFTLHEYVSCKLWPSFAVVDSQIV